MAKALKTFIAAVLGLLFCVKVLPILAIFFAFNSFFDKDDMENMWKETIDVWLKTPFAAAPRFIRRNNQIDEV